MYTTNAPAAETTTALADRPGFLRNVLLLDAATCVACGVLMSAGSKLVAGITLLPAGLLLSAGLSLFPIAAFVAFVATRAGVWRLGVWLAILGNASWVLGSLWLLLSGAVAPNALGNTFVIVQALVVAAVAWLEVMGVRRVRG